ncbi:MAG: flagellar assembly peptidoglycan hydrolase FlgJ [Rhodocyclales bacterium]|nr:flagellar assembly peptidoglycan hydrolase FlgJ [Rhodocyclales bacterium]
MNAADISPSIFDQSALASIKRQARSNDPAALKAVAQQFEALFMQMVLKSMRDATPKEGLFDSDQTRLYESLLDQQMSQVLAAKGGTGLAKIIESQLSRNAEAAGSSEPNSAAGGFVEKMMPHAAEASRSSGIPARFIVAQAALETGWGRAEPRGVDGQGSYNVFGIKAGSHWAGPTVEATTTEYVDGVARQRVERFRAYGSYAEAFKDYASLLAGNPRYAAALGSRDPAGFAQGLARAGYATDPAYAEKLTRIINSLPA